MNLRDSNQLRVNNAAPRIKRKRTSTRKRRMFERKVRQGCESWKLEPPDTITIDGMLGRGGRAAEPLWSDRRVVGCMSRTATERILTMFEQAPADRRFFWISLTDDVGTTSDRVPIVAIDVVRKKASKALRQAPLNALMALHVHPVTNHPRRGHGRSIMFHYHAIAWTDDAGFDPAAFERQIADSRAWLNSLGGPVVTIEELTTRGETRIKSRYMFRMAHDAKNRMPCKRRVGHFILMDTMKGYRPEFALRVFECMSQIGISEIITGVGEGCALADRLRTSVVSWHRSRPGPIVVPADFDTWAMWSRLRVSHGSKHYMPFRFRGCGQMPQRHLASHWAAMIASED